MTDTRQIKFGVNKHRARWSGEIIKKVEETFKHDCQFHNTKEWGDNNDHGFPTKQQITGANIIQCYMKIGKKAFADNYKNASRYKDANHWDNKYKQINKCKLRRLCLLELWTFLNGKAASWALKLACCNDDL